MLNPISITLAVAGKIILAAQTEAFKLKAQLTELLPHIAGSGALNQTRKQRPNLTCTHS